MAIFHLMQQVGLTIEEVDALTGPISGRPKSATFLTCDVVGIDTLVKVAQGVYDNCPNDESRDFTCLPSLIMLILWLKKAGLATKAGKAFIKKCAPMMEKPKF